MQKKPSNLVYLDNKLASASYSLNLSEQRLLYIILSKINQGYYRRKTPEEANAEVFLGVEIAKEDLRVEGDNFDSTTLYQLSVREYATFCNLRLDNARVDVIEAAKHLLNRKITLRKDDGGFCSFGWVQWVEYDASSDAIGIRWSYGILPYIRNLQKYFTKLKLNELLGLRSTYSWKLYQLLLAKKGENIFKKNVEIDLETILFGLDVPGSCKEFKMFKSKILEKSLKEIGERGLCLLLKESGSEFAI